jgi:hypothetical protein
MVTEFSRQGLIASASPLATPALREVIDCCGWPVLLHATPRQYRREMLVRIPEVSLFWLDDDRYVGATVQLLSWLGMYEPAVQRIAIGYRLGTNIEVGVRSAGAHLYLAADGDLRSMLNGAIAPWLRGRNLPAAGARKQSSTVQWVGCSQGPASSPLHFSGPP